MTGATERTTEETNPMTHASAPRTPTGEVYIVAALIGTGQRLIGAFANEAEAEHFRNEANKYHQAKPAQPLWMSMTEAEVARSRAPWDAWVANHPAGNDHDACRGFISHAVPWMGAANQDGPA